jgi:methionyl-tRNA synthetase
VRRRPGGCVPEAKAKDSSFKSPINGKPLVRKTEKNYFFRLSAYREPLLRLLEAGESVDGRRFTVEPDARRNEIVARIREMEDVPISRSGQGGWGIPFPGTHTDGLRLDRRAIQHLVRRRQRSAPLLAVGSHAADCQDSSGSRGDLAAAARAAGCDGYGWVNLPARVCASFWISEGRR